jgi:uncharacterized damage-inducible protein DinB
MQTEPMNTILANLFRHNRWANARMFEACLSLSEDQLGTEVPGTYGRLDATLLHLAAAEGGYLHTLTGWVPPEGYGLGEGVAFPGVPLLLERLRMTGDALVEVARELPSDRIVSGEDEDGSYSLGAWVVLLQAAYHATEHRQQIATALTHLGLEPPEPDLWAFDEARERGEVEVEPA